FDRPDDFDITRDPNRHLSFGRGRHRCPGAALTRAEVAEVLRQLAQGAPDLQLVDPAPRYKPNSFGRGLKSLTVRRDAHA
ncbi:MAG: cytochrome P450, partial [Actinobacteria bacterium]|nr:cytochrome P450 [Actinomycetota bacterium]